MAIDHITRIVNMFSKKELANISKNLNITIEEGEDEVEVVIRRLINGEEQHKNLLLHNYKFIFKPNSSHIYTYTGFNLTTFSQIIIEEWQIVERQQVGSKYYLLVERDTSSKRINAGWTYMNIAVKQGGIIVIHSDLNIVEIRSNVTVQKQLEKKLSNFFNDLMTLSIDRSYYTAILEELNAKEHSIVWGTEGTNVKKAQIEGENVSVKNGAVIHIKDENGDLIAVDLGTEGTPESVWSTLQDTDTKILLSSKGNLRVSKLVSEGDINNIILKIVSALKGLNKTQNTKLNFDDLISVEEVFYEFCSGTHKDILTRFSKRYLAFRCLLSDEDAENMLQYLQNSGFIQMDYEILCENEHHIATLNDISNGQTSLECEICSGLGIEYDSNNYQYKKIYRVSPAGFRVLSKNEVNVIENELTFTTLGMNTPVLNDDPVDLDEFLEKEEELIEVKRQQLEEAIEFNNQEKIKEIIIELKRFRSSKAEEVISLVGPSRVS